MNSKLTCVNVHDQEQARRFYDHVPCFTKEAKLSSGTALGGAAPRSARTTRLAELRGEPSR